MQILRRRSWPVLSWAPFVTLPLFLIGMVVKERELTTPDALFVLAVLFGDARDGVPTAQDWADAAGTISYEIVTRLGHRVPRIHVAQEVPA